MLAVAIIMLLAAQTAPSGATDGSARIVFFRTGGVKGLLVGCSVREDGKEIAQLPPNHAVTLIVTPSRHLYSTRGGTSTVSIVAAVGETQYVRCKMAGIIARPVLAIAEEKDYDATATQLRGATPR